MPLTNFQTIAKGPYMGPDGSATKLKTTHPTSIVRRTLSYFISYFLNTSANRWVNTNPRPITIKPHINAVQDQPFLLLSVEAISINKIKYVPESS